MKQFFLLLFMIPVAAFSQTKTEKLFKEKEKKFFDSISNEYQFDKVYTVVYDVKNSMELPAGSRAIYFVTPKKFASRSELEQYSKSAQGLYKRLTQAYENSVLAPAFTNAHANYCILTDKYLAAVCL